MLTAKHFVDTANAASKAGAEAVERATNAALAGDFEDMVEQHNVILLNIGALRAIRKLAAQADATSGFIAAVEQNEQDLRKVARDSSETIAAAAVAGMRAANERGGTWPPGHGYRN